MATIPNTSLANTNTVIYGSCKLEISSDSGVTWTNLGLARGVSFTEEPTITEIQSDNGPDIANYVSDHKATISWNALEFYIPSLDLIRGDIDTISVTSASATTRTDTFESSEWSYNQNILLVSQGDSTTLPAISLVKTRNSTGGFTTLTTSGKDYVKTLNQSNQRGVIVLSTDFGGNALDTEDLLITYGYGAIQARKLTSGGLSTITPRWFKLTNKQIVSGSAKYRTITFYSVSLASGLSMAFKSCKEADPVLEMPFTITAKLDTTRTAGDQLFMIEDEVGLT